MIFSDSNYSRKKLFSSFVLDSVKKSFLQTNDQSINLNQTNDSFCRTTTRTMTAESTLMEPVFNLVVKEKCRDAIKEKRVNKTVNILQLKWRRNCPLESAKYLINR